MRGIYVICDGSDRRQTITDVEEHPEGWLRVYLVREGGAEPEPLDFISFDALAEWAGRQQVGRNLGVKSQR